VLVSIACARYIRVAVRTTEQQVLSRHEVNRVLKNVASDGRTRLERAKKSGIYME
jgi:hypothetical protein